MVVVGRTTNGCRAAFHHGLFDSKQVSLLDIKHCFIVNHDQCDFRVLTVNTISIGYMCQRRLLQIAILVCSREVKLWKAVHLTFFTVDNKVSISPY